MIKLDLAIILQKWQDLSDKNVIEYWRISCIHLVLNTPFPKSFYVSISFEVPVDFYLGCDFILLVQVV